MKKLCLIVLITVMICGIAISITFAQFSQSGKIVITFNGFIMQGKMDEEVFRVISSKLTNALKNEMEKSGRFELWDKDYIKDLLKTMEKAQTFDFKSCSTEMCANKLAEISKADYSAFATLSKSVSSDTYNISLKLNRINKGNDLPEFDLENANNAEVV